jgi:hypothetical protein
LPSGSFGANCPVEGAGLHRRITRERQAADLQP